MDQAVDFIITYGYLAVFLGTVVWGETIMIAAGFSTSLPNVPLNLGLVMLFGAIGTIVADNFWYLVGHSGKRGSRFLERYERYARFKPRVVDKIKKRFEEHSGKTIFFSKFVYGARIIALVTAGAVGVKYSKFFFYNFLSIIFWAIGMGFVGYFLGEGFLEIKKYIKGAEFILLCLVVIVIVVKIIFLIRSRKSKKVYEPSK